MKRFLLLAVIPAMFAWPPVRAAGADGLKSTNTYAEAYGKTRNAVTIDPAKDLPRYPAIEPNAAPATWKVKPGFRLELAAHEPQVRDPIALGFDERGRMFVCEMIDYSERRDVTPHLGRVSMLEDLDGDGFYETSKVFADNLAWPTGVIWARGGLYVAATPDIWRFEDRDGDGRAEVRFKAFTGFGTGLGRLNVQSMLNSFQWGQDNRIHLLGGPGNRGKITSPVRPDLPGQEINGRDFWFNPLTHEFGFEPGGAQYGMSYDDFGRKFGCSNSDHLQYWVHDVDPGLSGLPPARQSIAVDGGAAEVFRISPDEPWRIVRTRWRIAGTVPGMVEGGGRVSGYFTGATGTTIYRGDAYGPAFVNNSFTGDAGGQLIHRKIIRLAADGVNLEGERPADERGVEFAASADTWVRIVNFANAPDGCLHVCDMYREVIEHPWSIPEEIKQHLDLNQGNDRGRIWRLVPAQGAPRKGQRVTLDQADLPQLVELLSHPNGWHRDTAQRLIYERQDSAVVPLLEKLVREENPPVAKLHALNLLAGLNQLSNELLVLALWHPDATVPERALVLERGRAGTNSLQQDQTMAVHLSMLLNLNPSARVRFQAALTVCSLLTRLDAREAQAALGLPPSPAAATPGRTDRSDIAETPARPRVPRVTGGGRNQRPLNAQTVGSSLADSYVQLARSDHGHPWIGPALLTGSPQTMARWLYPTLRSDADFVARAPGFMARLIEFRAMTATSSTDRAELITLVTQGEPRPSWFRALNDGLRRTGVALPQADSDRKLDATFAKAAAQATDLKAPADLRLNAIELLSMAPAETARPALAACLAPGQPDAIQAAGMKTLLQETSSEVTRLALARWKTCSDAARAVLLNSFLQRPERATALLGAIERGEIAVTALNASRVQALAQHKDPAIAAQARKTLAGVIPQSRAEVAAKFREAAGLRGDVSRGQAHFVERCAPCHRSAAIGQGFAVGPDLVTVKNRGREALLAAILDPDREVAAQYIVYDVTTKDGEAHAGFIADDNATSVTLKMAGGQSVTLLRSRVLGMTSGGRSLMPEGLEAGLTVQNMADLLTFIEER